ncbi:MAG: hypothetical protein SGI74_11525 [Oligoflexia bacterium]|nr:hypothetical protein [Oligoflexia bacterium]
MRLDTIGKPISAPATSFDKVALDKLRVKTISEPQATSNEHDASTSEGKSPRLGKILDLLEKSHEKKKEKNRNQKNKLKSEAIKAYQKFSCTDASEQVGQGVNIKV